MNIANELFFEQVEAGIATGHSVEILVKGHSMRPLLQSDRDRVVLSPIGTQQLSVGDVVLFRFRGRHILHRIVRIECIKATEPGTASGHMSRHTTRHTTERTTERTAERTAERTEYTHNDDYHRFTLSGDGNSGMTEQCSEADVVAVVTAVIRPSGHIVATQSLRWRIASRTWAALPQRLRGVAWRILQKFGY